MNRRLFIALSVLAVFFAGCKKKEKEASCSDGIHNGIETGVDCGGNCAACTQNTVPPYAILTVDGKQVSFANHSISAQAGYYRLILVNDSINLSLNIGPGTTGAGSVSQTGTSLIYNNQNYPDLNHGQRIISANDTAAHTMSGNFNATFGYSIDSVRITSGQFYRISY